MAAMRSALAALSRCSGSSAAGYSMAGRGLEIRRLIGAASARTPPLIRPATVRNPEGWPRFSTESMKGADQSKLLLMKHKAESILRMRWQWSRDSVYNLMKDSTLVATAISFTTTLCFLKWAFLSTSSTGDNVYDDPILESPLPLGFAMMPCFQAWYISSLRPVRHDQAMTSMKTKVLKP